MNELYLYQFIDTTSKSARRIMYSHQCMLLTLMVRCWKMLENLFNGSLSSSNK